MKIKPECLPQSVIDRLQELADKYPHAELELYGDVTKLSDDDLEEIEGFIRLDAGEGVDVDEMIAEARSSVARARVRQGLAEAEVGRFSDRTVADIARAVLDKDE